MKAASFVVLLAFAFPTSVQSQVYACMDDAVQGFEFSDKGAVPTKYTPKRFIAKLEGNNIQWSQPSEKPELYKCSATWPHVPHLVQCVENMYFIVFDKKLLRYTRSKMYSHVDRSNDSLTISFGGCQPF